MLQSCFYTRKLFYKHQRPPPNPPSKKKKKKERKQNEMMHRNMACSPDSVKCPVCVINLIHFNPVSHFYTPWKRQKTKDFSDVFRGYRNVTLD